MKSTPQEFLSLLFLSRDAAHQAHWNTDSYAKHVALGAFYDGVIELADKFAEAYMGRTGQKIGDLPEMKSPKGEIAKILKVHLELIEEMRGFVKKEDTPLNNIIDEIVDLYLSTLFLLTLK